MRLGNYAFLLTVGLSLACGVQMVRAEAPKRPTLVIAPQAPRVPGPLLSIVKMVESGVDTNVVVAFIDSCAAPFGMTVNDVLDLRAKGVSSDVIAAMLRHDAQIVQISRTTPPVTSAAAPSTGEDSLVADSPSRQSAPVENPMPQAVANDEDLASYGWWWGGFQDSGRRWRHGGNVGPGVRPAKPDTQSFPAATIPGTVPLVQPTVPLVRSSPRSLPRPSR